VKYIEQSLEPSYRVTSSMAPTYQWIPVTVASIGVAWLVQSTLSWKSRTKDLPPGPPKLPLLDNLHNMPGGIDWVKFKELGDRYGESSCRIYGSDWLEHKRDCFQIRMSSI
jgi:hypothetical protein